MCVCHALTQSFSNSLSTEADVFGRVKQVELLPGGANVAVTEENKQVRAW